MEEHIKAVFDRIFELEIGVQERQEMIKKELECDHETFIKYLKQYISETVSDDMDTTKPSGGSYAEKL